MTAPLVTAHTVTRADVLPGFWQCCQARPEYAVWFTREIPYAPGCGVTVWHAACPSCASAIGSNRRATVAP